MILWAVTMVRDELDVIEHVLRHTASEGVSGLIVADNMSVDGTWEWLNDHRDTFPCEVVLERDEVVGYYQAQKMTRLVHEARLRGAEWVLPFDADEVWFNADQPLSLADTLTKEARAYDCIEARLFNHFGTSTDNQAELNPFRRITHRDEAGSRLRKVIVRARADVALAQGNHDAVGMAPFQRVGSTIQVGHFPWRTYPQFESKCRNGSEAYGAASLPADMGAHWRQYGQFLQQGPNVLRDIYDEWFFDPELELTEAPVPFRRFG